MRTLSCREKAVSITVLIIASIGSITTSDVYGQSLGKLFFEEKGKITGQKPVGDNKMEVSYSSNGTMNSNIDVTTSGNFYKFLAIGRLDGGKPIFIGASIYDTNSTGKLAFLDNQVGVFKVDIDKQGNFVNKEWEWK
jgi:hypothetical protein